MSDTTVRKSPLPRAAAAKHVGLSVSTMDKMRVRGDGPRYLVIGKRRVFYEEDSLDQFMRSREHRSTSEYVS